MIIAITAFNRPNYLRQLLDSLNAAADRLDEPTYVTARVEPSPVQSEITRMLLEYDCWVVLNDEQLGHVVNIRTAFNDGFELGQRYGEDFVMWLADDLVISPDALVCTKYMRDTFRHVDHVVSTALHWQRSEPKPSAFDAVGLRYNIHNSQGHGIWLHSWPWHLGAWEPVEAKRQRGVDPEGYKGNDQCISARLRAEKKTQAAPMLARVYSTGVENGPDPAGMHATAHSLKGDNPTLYAGNYEPVEKFRKAHLREYDQVIEAWANYERAVAAGG